MMLVATRTYTRQEWALLSAEQRGPCAEWSGARNAGGYGRRTYQSNTELAHRVRWLMDVGPIPLETPHVLHHCDNPPCERLSHLWLGTDAENTADKMAKGRINNRPERARTVRLSWAAVQDIRARGVKGEGNKRYTPGNVRQLATEYGVTESAILAVINHRTWKEPGAVS